MSAPFSASFSSGTNSTARRLRAMRLPFGRNRRRSAAEGTKAGPKLADARTIFSRSGRMAAKAERAILRPLHHSGSSARPKAASNWVWLSPKVASPRAVSAMFCSLQRRARREHRGTTDRQIPLNGWIFRPNFIESSWCRGRVSAFQSK